MGNLVKDVTSYDQRVFKISGRLAKNMVLKAGETDIKVGQLLSFDELTGEVSKYTTDGIVFSIALSEFGVLPAIEGEKILVAVPGTVFNSKEVIAIEGVKFNPKTDHKIIKELWGNGIILEEVE